ncbi:hypothetical protein GCM10020331_007500 [Ectobacillus funiculus]
MKKTIAKKVEAKLAKVLDTETQVFNTSYGNIDIRELLQKKQVKATVISHKHHACSHDHHACSHSHEHHEHEHSHVHHSGIKTITIQDVPSLSRRKIEKKWLKSLPEGIIRGKGYVSLEDERGIYPFQYSSNQVYISEFSQEQAIDPCIVLIGKRYRYYSHSKLLYGSNFCTISGLLDSWEAEKVITLPH